MREEIIARIPQKDAGTTLEAALVHSDTNEACVELRHLAWGKGLGWYRQKTLRLEAPAAYALLRALGQVRHRLVPGDATAAAGKVIPFPDVAVVSPGSKRRAM